MSVMMLREGWDVRNVKVIVPTRPCDSRTLTEQALGRGLRKMHAPELDADGGAEVIDLQPDNPSFKVRTFSAGSEEIRVVAELVEVLA